MKKVLLIFSFLLITMITLGNSYDIRDLEYFVTKNGERELRKDGFFYIKKTNKPFTGKVITERSNFNFKNGKLHGKQEYNEIW